MTIDPRLYEKVTGRMPGDAQKAYGEALAKNSARGRGSRGRSSDMVVGFRWHWWASIIFSIFVLIVLILTFTRWLG